MSFARMAYNPVTGLSDTGHFPTNPADEAAARKQFQDMFDQILVGLNSLMTALESVTDSSSGADNIGLTTISGVTGATVQAALENIKVQFDELVAGEVDPASILTAGAINASTMFDDGVVTGSKIADDTITSDNLADDSVTADQIADGAVTSDKLGAGAVKEAKIENGAVTYQKLAYLPQIAFGANKTLSYDFTNNILKFWNSTTPVQIATILYGTSATPPAGTYPAGTLYVQYEA